MNVDVDGDDDVLLMMRCYPSAYVNRNVSICNYIALYMNINVNLNTLILDIRSVERASRQTQINGNSNYDIESSVGAR